MKILHIYENTANIATTPTKQNHKIPTTPPLKTKTQHRKKKISKEEKKEKEIQTDIAIPYKLPQNSPDVSHHPPVLPDPLRHPFPPQRCHIPRSVASAERKHMVATRMVSW